METFLKTIKLNDTGYHVTLLHKALAALGNKISDDEIARRIAGQSTRENVRALQEELGLQADDRVLVDAKTAQAIIAHMTRKRLISPDRQFTISGTVRQETSEISKSQQVIAFDLDLKGVAAYRTLENLPEEEAGGFEVLGEAVTDHDGNYTIKFYDWQYTRAERKKADVVCYAHKGNKIFGHSRMVNVGDYSDEGSVRGIDIILPNTNKRTEYQALMEPLETFLKESVTRLAEIAKSSEQLIFTANELAVDRSHLRLAATAALVAGEEVKLLHELLYGIARQDVSLSWTALYKQKDDELSASIKKSMDDDVIGEFSERTVLDFISNLKKASISHILGDKDEGEDNNAVTEMLLNALPDVAQHKAFLSALHDFEGDDFRDFWETHLLTKPDFENNRELIPALQLSQQLSALSGNHPPLLKELQHERGIKSAHELIEFENEDWLEIIKKTDVPDFIEGADEVEKRQRYADVLQNRLNAAFPTQRIAKMLDADQLGIQKIGIKASIKGFFASNPDFDFATKRIHDFKEKIITATEESDPGEVTAELMKFQRVFQVSTDPAVMAVLLKNNLHSAYSIATIPRGNFLKTYSKVLGNKKTAASVHQRAEFIAKRAELVAMDVKQFGGDAATPAMAMSGASIDDAADIFEEKFPNYKNLFGSPDLCECQHCRSVYSPAAYFVELLQFLRVSKTELEGLTPYDILVGKNGGLNSKVGRRPDLAELPLSCENTNTLIPYIDLANEVMEFYAAESSLEKYKGQDTAGTTADELRANPQYTDMSAYENLKNAKYPFSLPYHQPLDEIRTYSDYLGASRYEVMRAINSPPKDNVIQTAIEYESLKLSHEAYTILVDGTSDQDKLREYFGYKNVQGASEKLENLSQAQEFMSRSGISYADLIKLFKTFFINPGQTKLDYIEKIFSNSSVDNKTIYNWLKSAAAGAANSNDDAQIQSALDGYNDDSGSNIGLSDLADWASQNFTNFEQIITLFEPNSACDLSKTELRTIRSIYDPSITTSGIIDKLSKLHRFIRLWRKTGWSIHETDLMLGAMGEDDINPESIAMLESVLMLKKASKQSLNKLAVLWGSIDTYGIKSLYRKLFLNRSVQRIDSAFVADLQGNYLQDSNEKLEAHRSTILAAFVIKDDELEAILKVAKIIDGGASRLFDMSTDTLTLPNLSTLYRYVVLAKALKMRVRELCTLIQQFDVQPFSLWDIGNENYTQVSPEETYKFYMLAASTKAARFRPEVLEYIFTGRLPVDSKLGLDENKILLAAKSIRHDFTTIEQIHPKIPDALLSGEIVAAKLSISFQPEIVSRFIEIVDGTAIFKVKAEANLNVEIPEALKDKYSYVKSTGWLSCIDIMSEADRLQLGALDPSEKFNTAVQQLHDEPEHFIRDNFDEVFGNLDEARKKLLNHPAQASAASLEDKLSFIYEQYLPLLKVKLRRDTINTHIANLIELSEEATSLLIADENEELQSKLSSQGFSVDYFNGTTWDATERVAGIEPVDNIIDFTWVKTGPNRNLPAPVNDSFSARWKSYISAPASGDYTLIVEVEEADEAVHLYLDGEQIITKLSNDNTTSLEAAVNLNAAQLHLLVLEYAEKSDAAGVRLRWKTATGAPEIIPANAAYPADILDSFVKDVNILHRAAKFISGFKISETELKHFVTFSANFDDINFKAIGPKHWLRIRDYSTLRDSVPQAEAFLTDVFALANKKNPTPEMDAIEESIRYATGWDKANLNFLVQTDPFNFVTTDFKNEIALNRLLAVMNISAKTGLAAKTIAQWGTPETGFDNLHETAQLLKNAVKAKYDDGQWLEIAGGLSDKLREQQKRALISFLLVQTSIKKAGVEDADGLFELLLIDVQMGACMDTSRIVQASAAIQLFVNRILLNLEPEISPDTIDTDRWEWMKNYRVWEANRKVFLYPENWLAPEWRNDRSEFFKELESHLLQNDITKRSAEQGLRNYLMSLNEVANLEVCGMHQENDADGNPKILHVFGRTHNLPYKYFYRRWNEHKKWSAWEKVQVDIRSVEDGKNSGVHLIPVVWKDRLFLFWPEFMEKAEESKKNSTRFKDLDEETPNNFKPNKYWEIRLAWSEYVDGVWSSKQVSKEYVTDKIFYFDTQLSLFPDYDENINETHLFPDLEQFRFTPNIHQDPKVLTIAIRNGIYFFPRFVFADIQSPMKISRPRIRQPLINSNDALGVVFSKPNAELSYNSFFMSRKKTSNLKLLGNTYLTVQDDHKLITDDRYHALELSLGAPFFFNHATQNYFVETRPITIIEGFRKPNQLNPGGALNLSLAFEGIGDNGPSPEPEASGPFTFNATSANFNINAVFTEAAFDSPNVNIGSGPIVSHQSRGLSFNTFYHPFSSQFITNLNQGGVASVMVSDTEILSDDGSNFEKAYNPKFQYGLVKKLPSNGDRTYYQENICFDPLGANSLYNWELFFHAPLYIANRLSKNGKYEEAMKWFHYIFDPTTNEKAKSDDDISRYWKVRPFKAESETVETLESWFRKLQPNPDPGNLVNELIDEWRDNPFDPHLVAGRRPVAYMKHVVIKYVENLIDWGDSLFRQFTRESVYEAIQLYVIASHILGKRPEFVPKRGEIQTETYANLKDKLDDFGNALIELENIFPYSSEVNSASPSTGGNLLGIGPALYFCVPANDKLLEYWDTVADRLYKIRHCQDFDGVERSLALFAPAIDPAALIQARSQGLSLGSILADLSSPPPIYRFTFLMQKANEFCNDVKALGSAILSALEKKDGEELSRLRASQESQMLELVTAIRERQVLTARANVENLQKSRETAKFRMQHYKDLLGDDSDEPPDAPSLDATLTADSQLPVDTSIAPVETNVDMSLVDSDENGVKLISREAEQLSRSEDANRWQNRANEMELLANLAYFIPDFIATTAPLGTGFQIEFGGKHIGPALSATAKAFNVVAAKNLNDAQRAGQFSSFIRRTHDWTLQANLAIREIVGLDKQITSADIQIQIAEKELQNHKQQIENTKQVALFIKDKFTNQELYQWMRDQLFSVYKQSYNLAFELAKKAEKAYLYELGTETTNFIQYGYWDNSTQGLVAGEKLQLALRQLENSFLDTNRRELELSKSISLAMLDPLALIELKETGKCHLSLPEELFDLDFQGHYFRRIKAVSLSIPCVAGPYTTVNCSLRLLKNSIRKNTLLNSDFSGDDDYEHDNDTGLPLDDDRFRASSVPVALIATSTGQNDAGMFEFNFRDERYLPFEGAGVISNWMIELSTEKELRQFDYETISDVILHVKYTAREGGGTFKGKAVDHIKNFIEKDSEQTDHLQMLVFSMKHDFPTEWHRFLHSSAEAAEHALIFTIGKHRFPFFSRDRDIKVAKIDAFANTYQGDADEIVLSQDEFDSTFASFTKEATNPHFGDLHHGVLNPLLFELDIEKELHLRLKSNGQNTVIDPSEVEDLLLVLHYKFSPL